MENWDELLADILDGVDDYLSEPHAFYGHCFGGRVAYELTHLTHTRQSAQTRRLFVSACRSPDTPQAGRYIHDLPDPEFIDALRQLGASDEVLQNKSILRYVLPAVRSEIRLAELWTNRHRALVRVPITAIYGSADAEGDRPSMEGWQMLSAEGCELIEVPGGHSIFDSGPSSVAEIVNARMGAASRAH